MPYYYSGSYLQTDEYVEYNSETNTGKVSPNDGPNTYKYHKSVWFYSAIVARDYMRTGKDLVLGVFEWGWKNGKKDGKFNLMELSKRARAIIKQDFPEYKLFGEE